MKNTLLFLLTITSLSCFGNGQVDSIKLTLAQARNMADSKSPKYKPSEAFIIYSKLALQGNALAMNGLAMLYSQGIGTVADDHQALQWFEKSARNGYARSYYNLALIYKGGIGADQDQAKAYQYYQQGAKLNDPLCLYGQGYMLYKGYGCVQNYEQAVPLFRKGAAFKEVGSAYMLGLCFRNGYGVAANADSAKYWLNAAARHGDQRAVHELAEGNPENTNLQRVPDIQPAKSVSANVVNLKTGFQQVKHQAKIEDLTGDYNGYAVKFDWSGKHIIGQAALQLHLTINNNVLTGEWKEEGQQQVALSGILSDTALTFNNTSFDQIDHYHKSKPLATQFKGAHLNVVKSRDTVYLTGTLRLYSPLFKEQQKPEFMMLMRKVQQKSTLSDTSFNHLADNKADSVHFVAYPNPFTSDLKLRYTLKKKMWVSIFISDIQTGRIVYRSANQQLVAGDYDSPIYFNGPPGNYIVTLQYDKWVKSAIIFKR